MTDLHFEHCFSSGLRCEVEIIKNLTQSDLESLAIQRSGQKAPVENPHNGCLSIETQNAGNELEQWYNKDGEPEPAIGGLHAKPGQDLPEHHDIFHEYRDWFVREIIPTVAKAWGVNVTAHIIGWRPYQHQCWTCKPGQIPRQRPYIHCTRCGHTIVVFDPARDLDHLDPSKIAVFICDKCGEVFAPYSPEAVNAVNDFSKLFRTTWTTWPQRVGERLAMYGSCSGLSAMVPGCIEQILGIMDQHRWCRWMRTPEPYSRLVWYIETPGSSEPWNGTIHFENDEEVRQYVQRYSGCPR